jgi:hypothetical protein
VFDRTGGTVASAQMEHGRSIHSPAGSNTIPLEIWRNTQTVSPKHCAART